MFVTWDRHQSVTLGSEPSSQETERKHHQWVHMRPALMFTAGTAMGSPIRQKRLGTSSDTAPQPHAAAIRRHWKASGACCSSETCWYGNSSPRDPSMSFHSWVSLWLFIAELRETLNPTLDSVSQKQDGKVGAVWRVEVSLGSEGTLEITAFELQSTLEPRQER